MNKSQHTPGPWQFVAIPRQDHEDGSVTVPHFRVDGDGWEGLYTDSMMPVGIDEREANARLIAAAPELLSATQGLLLWLADETIARRLEGREDCGPVKAALAAIAKARGEQVP